MAKRIGKEDKQLRTLQRLLLDDAVQIASGLNAAVEAAPLNQRAQALGLMIDKIIKLEEWLRHSASQEANTEGQVIRFEFQYPDGSIHDAPPWANANPGDAGTLPGRRVWTPLWEDGDGQAAAD